LVAWDGCSVTRLAKDVAAKLWPPVAARCQQVRNGRGTIRGRRCGPRVLRLRSSCSSCSSRTGTPTRRSAQPRISLGATRCVLVADRSVTVTGKVHGSVQRAVCRPVLAHLSRIGRRAASTSCQRSGWHCCLSRFHLWLMRSRCLTGRLISCARTIKPASRETSRHATSFETRPGSKPAHKSGLNA
jgi:hypothetical protein